MFSKIINKFRTTKAQGGQITKVSDLDAWSSFTFPLIKRVYPSLVSSQIVSVQPMQAPPPGWQTRFSGNTVTYTKRPNGQKGKLISHDLVEDILNNMERIEACLGK